MSKKVFEYTRKAIMNELEPEQQQFMAKIVEREVKEAAKRLDVSEEVAYEMYCKGLLGSDRSLG